MSTEAEHLARCRALVEAGRRDEAAEAFRRWLSLDPGSATASYLRAAWLGEGVPPRAPDRYVAALFDHAAAHYDPMMRALGYRVPDLIARALAEEFPAGAELDVLDAGCGTGLCGPALRPYARRLEGVDLSAGMLERAALRGCYDALAAGELTAYLGGHADRHDLIVAADVLVYFGELEPVLSAAGSALRPGGTLVFSVERGAGGSELAATGRYRHGEGAVRRALAAAGLGVRALAVATLRREGGEPVEGLLVRAR